MKTKLFSKVLIIMTIALSAIIVIQGCKKSVSPFDPSDATYMYHMKGQVVDAQSNSGIAGASVRIFDQTVTTDVNGYFSFKVSYATDFPFVIYADATDYLLGSTLISGPAQVRAVRLTMQNPGVVIDATGGTLKTSSAESLSGNGHEIAIPAGALSQPVTLSFTGMEDFYFLYGKSTEAISNIDLATVSIAPAGQSFQKPVTLKVSLPFRNDAGTGFPVYRYDLNSNLWINTGKTLIVDVTMTSGTVELSQAGIYSVACAGTFSEEVVSQSVLKEYSCQGETPLTWQALIDHPQGTPTDVSPVWLKNAISHNTILGGHVSFIRPTNTAVVCEPYQPGSSYAVPSDEIQINGNPYPCPSGTNPLFLNKGVYINKRMINFTMSFVSYSAGPKTNQVPGNATVQVPVQTYEYWCPHDQGGGK